MAGFIKDVIILSLASGIFCCCNPEIKNSSTGLSTYDELNKASNLTVVDSLTIKNEYRLYWFCVDFGVRGYSTGRIGIAKNKMGLSHEESILIISDGITDFSVENDTLYIECVEGYDLGNIEIDPSIVKFTKVLYSGIAENMIINRIENNKRYPLIKLPPVE